MQDKLAGKPWITRLPFPVHCVAKVTVADKWRNTTFASTYSYHHGYFDGVEREFRGFGRVDQVDTEDYGKFLEGNIGSPYITNDQTLYQPPVKTITWYHTGAALDRQRILSQFAHEYFEQRFADRLPNLTQFPNAFRENPLPEPELPDNLNIDEWREALRACKGMMLRQEIYELDVDDLTAEAPKHTAVRIFSAATHNCHIEMLQARGENRHAIFLVTESEALIYNYELALPKGGGVVEPDPRVSHTLNLKTDEYGNVLESAAAVYTRRVVNDDQLLTEDQRALIHRVQNEERHLALNCTDYTKDIFDPETHRLPVPCQTQSWEVTGVSPAGNYFTLSELRSKNLVGNGAAEIPYHQVPPGTTAQKRLIESARTLFFADDLTSHRDFRKQGPLSLTYESYKLALTKDLLDRVLADPDRLNTAYAALDAQANGYPISGYYKGDQLFPNDPISPAPLAEQYWIASGRAGFNPDAALHFYLPERYTDPFGNLTMLAYDLKYDLFLQSSTDARGNSTRIDRFDYRVLAPSEIVDINSNHSEVYFDVRGMVVALAVKGKQIAGQWEGDNLGGFTDALANPLAADVVSFCTSPTLNDTQAHTWLGNANTLFVYHFGERVDTSGHVVWNDRMAGACGIVRERHASQVASDPVHENPLQVALECSDGAGNVLMKKVQAAPNPANGQTRWIVNGLTVLNNKGKPVKQYEPAFSNKFGCELPQPNGVSTTTYYDAPGRVVRVEMPDGSFSRVEFSPWEVRSYDANDTAYDSQQAKRSDWYNRRTDPLHPRFAEFNNPDYRRAADLVETHANTPALTFLDTLGRSVVNVAHNKYKDRQGTLHDEKTLTFTRLDAEGKPLWIRDARRNLVMQYITPIKPTRATDEPDPAKVEDVPVNGVPCYDIAGNLLYQHSMDAGDRWMLNDAAGKPMLAWDRNERQTGTTLTAEERLYSTRYDALHRPTEQWLTIDTATPKMIERFEYHDTAEADPNGDALKNNLRGKLVRHYDCSGLTTLRRVGFKGNTEEVHRTLTNQYKASIIDWQGDQNAQSLKLESESFVQITRHDALGRMTRLYNWHRDVPHSRVAVYVPSYNQRGMLMSETLDVRATKKPIDHDPSGNPLTKAIVEIRYNAKGQKTYLKLGNGSVTRYTYDQETFRLRRLYTYRDARFTDDCGDDPPPPRTAAPDIDSPPRSCGVQNLSYTYDPLGNITHIQDDAQQAVYFQNARVEPSSDYTYDALYRLVQASGREDVQLNAPPTQVDGPPISAQLPITGQTLRTYTQNYRYDSVGNIEQMAHVANTSGQGAWTRYYEYATDSNRLSRTWHGDADWNNSNAKDKTTYVYDTHGNMLNLAQVSANQYLRWDYRDMIASLDLVGGGWAYYNYDSSKQRTRKRIDKQNNPNGYWERIYLDGYELYRRYSGVGSTTPVEEIESHHLFEGEQRVLLVDDVIKTDRTHADGTKFKTDPILRYQYSNHLGSACLELDDQAEIISYEEYHPYGTSAYRAMKSGIEAPPKRYRYTGMERDEESGLSYHSARYYAPWLAAWLSCDPSCPNEGLNCYRYVGANPMNFIDPNGRQAMPVTPGQMAAMQKMLDEISDVRKPRQIVIPAEDHSHVMRMMPDGT
ncbi:MAG: RHS repeat-associated core domain-containing protein, partial [Pyrinomonadaceae bacterium]